MRFFRNGEHAVARNTDGRLEFFTLVETSNNSLALYHKKQEIKNGKWGLWHSLGSEFLGTPVVIPEHQCQWTIGTFHTWKRQ